MDSDHSLHAHGLKATQPRVRVLELLRREQGRHLTADEVHRLLVVEGMDVGLATVYRVLGQLEQVGIVRRNVFAAGPAVFEFDEGEHHDHLLCRRCGQVEEFLDPGIESLQQEVARRRGFELVEHRLAMFGVCRACREAVPDVPG